MMTRREIALKASQAAAAAKAARRALRGKPGVAWHKTKPGRASMLTITPAPAKLVEQVRVQEITFLTNLRLGLMRTDELLAARNDREARLQQAARLAGPLKKVATMEENQLRVELILFDLELKRRALADCQRKRID